MKKLLLAPLYLTYNIMLIFGNYSYITESYDSAISYYDIAIMHPGDDFMAAEVNKAAALYRQGNYDNSIEVLKTVISDTRDEELKQRAYYNLGNNYFKLGEAQVSSGKFTEGATNWLNAIQEYENSLRINPEDTQAKENIEFIKELLKQAYDDKSQSNKPSPTPVNQDNIKQNEIRVIKEKETENLKNFKIENQLKNYTLNFDKEEEYW